MVSFDLNNLAGAFYGRGLAEEVAHLLVAYLEKHGHTPSILQATSASFHLRDRRNMRLENNQLLATIVGLKVEGGQMTIPNDLAGSWGVVLFYRGEW